MEKTNLIISKTACSRIVSAIAGIVIITGLLAIIGWLFDVEILKAIQPNWITMKFNTAICFVLSGISLWCVRDEKKSASRFIIFYFTIGVQLLICLLTLGEYLFSINIGIDQLIIIDRASAVFQGRMSLATALNFILLGLAFLIIDLKYNKWLYQCVIAPVFPIALVSFLIYLFAANTTYRFAYYFFMAMHTAILFMLLCFALFMARPNAGFTEILLSKNAGGRFVQRVILLVLSIPILLVFFVNLAEKYNLFDSEFGNAIIVVVHIAIVSLVVYINAYIINRDEKALLLADESVLASEKIFHAFADQSQDVFWRATANLDKIIYVNKSFETIWGITAAELYKNPNLWFESILSDDRPYVDEMFFKKLVINEHASATYRIKRPDGQIRYILDRGFILKDNNGNITDTLGVAVDLTDIRQLDQLKELVVEMNKLEIKHIELAEINYYVLERLGEILSLKIGEIWINTPDSEKLERIKIWHHQSLHNTSFKSQPLLLNKIYKRKTPLVLVNQPNERELLNGEPCVIGLSILAHGDHYGVMVLYPEKMHELSDELLGSLENISNKLANLISNKYQEKRISELMLRDKTTNFLNQAALEEKIGQIIVAKQYESAAVIVLNIISFDRINKAFGANASVLLLQLVAESLQKNVLLQDDIPAYLLDGKFAIFIPNVNKKSDIIKVIDNILAQFDNTFALEGQDVFLKVDVGVARFPDDSVYATELIEYATIAAIENIDFEHEQYKFYSKQLQHRNTIEFKQEIELRNAIINNEFELYYQPEVDLKTGSIVGLEALIRWNSPTKGMIYPGDFISMAEKSGLIILLDEWVLRDVFKKIKQNWFGSQHIIISVNISALHFKKKYNLLAKLKALITEFDIDPSLLEIEVTESIFLAEPQQPFAIMTEIAKAGFHLALDDFGTGYSSLSYLFKIPAGKIKIDKIFVDGLPVKQFNMMIVKAIIQLAHQLGKTVIAEGVETEEQLTFLIQEKCDMMQGYYFSKPMAADDIRAMLRSQKTMKRPD